MRFYKEKGRNKHVVTRVITPGPHMKKKNDTFFKKHRGKKEETKSQTSGTLNRGNLYGILPRSPHATLRGASLRTMGS